jgi:hypothetical protein
MTKLGKLYFDREEFNRLSRYYIRYLAVLCKKGSSFVRSIGELSKLFDFLVSIGPRNELCLVPRSERVENDAKDDTFFTPFFVPTNPEQCRIRWTKNVEERFHLCSIFV